MAEKGDISGKRLRFVAEYCVDQNGTQAAVRAGYSARSARQQATRMLSDAAICVEIEARCAKISADLGITAERVLAEQARIAFGGMSRFLRIGDDGEPVIDLSNCTPEDLDQLVEVQVEAFIDGRGEEAKRFRRIKLKPMDKQRALEFLGKHLGLFKDPAADAQDVATDAVRDLVAALTPKGSKAPIAPSRPRGAGGD